MMRNGQVEAAASQLNRLANSSAPDAKERAAAYVWLAQYADELDDALAQEFGGWMYGRW